MKLTQGSFEGEKPEECEGTESIKIWLKENSENISFLTKILVLINASPQTREIVYRWLPSQTRETPI